MSTFTPYPDHADHAMYFQFEEDEYLDNDFTYDEDEDDLFDEDDDLYYEDDDEEYFDDDFYSDDLEDY